MLNRVLQSLSILAISTLGLQAQTTLFTESFNGTVSAFLLNTSDVSSTAGTGGANYWIINNSYTGGTGSLSCLGIPLSFTVPNTATQPAGITGNPNSKYLHIVSTAGVTSGITNACFAAADGLCFFDENNFSKMSTDVSTVGYDSIELSFWWLCTGGAQSYGEVYYSSNAGSTWTQVSTPISNYNNQSNWVQQKITLPAFENLSTLRFGFRFVNAQTSSASEPSFSVDDVVIKGFVNAPVNTIAAPTFSGTAFCPGDQLTVNFTVTGTYTAGNVFTAQLSNASGSFAAPTAIGNITATSAGPIAATIPLGTPAGTGYRIRVISSNPATTGADNGVNITVAAGAIAGTASLSNDTICSGTNTAVSLTGFSGSIIWEESTTGSNFVGSTNYTGTSFTTFNLTQDLFLRAIVQSNCGADTSNVIRIVVLPTPAAAFGYNQSGSSLAITFANNTSGSYSSVSWAFGDGNSTVNDNPTHTYNNPGNYVVTLTVTGSNGCSSSIVDTVSVFPVAVEHVAALLGAMQVYPNPNKGQFTLSLDLATAQTVNINLVDLQGRRVAALFSGTLSSGTQLIALNANNLPSGMYILEVQGDKGRQWQKILIE